MYIFYLNDKCVLLNYPPKNNFLKDILKHDTVDKIKCFKIIYNNYIKKMLKFKNNSFIKVTL